MAHHPFRFGVVAAQASSGDAWVARARRAEDLGYATFLIPDTLGQELGFLRHTLLTHFPHTPPTYEAHTGPTRMFRRGMRWSTR